MGLLYGFIAQLRHMLYDLDLLTGRHAGVPTISVGNLTVGGTGKTPFVEGLARSEGERGIRVAILSRGYGSSNGYADDEQLSSKVPSTVRRWTNPDRIDAAREAIRSFHPDLLLMDDGFQHRQMARDLDIVLVDGLRRFGNGYPLPAGPLREPVAQIRRADVVVITRTNRISTDELRNVRRNLKRYLPPDVSFLYAEHRPVRIVEHASGEGVETAVLNNEPFLAFCGIGTPESFERTLRDDLRLDPVDLVTYPDHYRYTDSDRQELLERAREEGANCLVTTRKDAVKWPKSMTVPLYFVEVELRVTKGRALLDRALKQVLSPDPDEIEGD